MSHNIIDVWLFYALINQVPFCGTKVEDEVATSSTNMPQILAFIIFIGLGASFLWNRVQPGDMNFFKAAISEIRQTAPATQPAQSPAPSQKTTRQKTSKNPALQTPVSKKPEVSVIINTIDNFGKIKISQIRKQTLSEPYLITLYANNLQKDEQINISGWEIKTKNGSLIISRGQDIIVKSGDIIYISSDPNPFLERDKNFRPNKCLGYLAGSRNFTIPLPQTCPRPKIDKLPSYLNYWCKEYINTLGSCQAPTYDGLAKYELFKDDNCLFYLNANLNYSGCFLNYQKDHDFFSNQWHIYLDRRDKEIFSWTNEFDTLYLRDRNGLLIDKYDFGQRVCCD